MAQRLTSACLALALATSGISCASAPRARVANAVASDDLDGALEAYEDLRRFEGADAPLLGRVAGLLLLREASSGEPARRRAAIGQLALSGNAGLAVLRQIAEGDASDPAVVGALVALARRDQGDAKLRLRALADSDDLDVVAASVLGMDPELDRALLRSLLESTSAAVRAAAASGLAPAAEDSEVLRALATVARVDPEARVRASAVRSLGQGGGGAISALRERLGDAEGSVRMAAVGALVRADQTQGLAAIGPLLEVSPSPAGIEAARWIAQLDGDDVEADATHARAFLRRALFADDAALRAQAGVALTGLPRDAEGPFDAVRQALAQESDATVRLSFARALLRADRAHATPALERLLAEDGMPRVQAAAILAGTGHERGLATLFEVARSDAETIFRQTAVRALAKEAGRPDAARTWLQDDDPFVRIFAAGGILAAS